MLVAISGAQSTGKTTVIEGLKKLGYSTRSEITRDIKRKGFKINEEGDDNTQIAIINEHLNRLSLSMGNQKAVILDRCLLDGVVYTHYLYNKGTVQRKTLNFAIKQYEQYMSAYDVLFYVAPEFDIVDDNERSTDVEFRDDIVSLFKMYLASIDTIPVIRLSGTPEERVSIITEYLNN